MTAQQSRLERERTKAQLLQERAERLKLQRFETWTVTPLLLSEALKEAGLLWTPSKTWAGGPVEGHYLYAWVAPQALERADVLDHLQRSPVLYIGISASATPQRRLQEETNWSDAHNPTMGLSLAVSRHAARAVYGEVTLDPSLLECLLPHEDDGPLVERAADMTSWAVNPQTIGRNLVLFWRGIKLDRPVEAAESLAIRCAIHLGHIGAPVNSSGAGAWESEAPADWMAYAVRGQLEQWTSPAGSDLSARI